MAIGVQQFQVLNPDEVSPFGGLLRNSLQKYGDIINAAYLPKEKQQSLQQHIADTLLKNAQAKRENALAELPFGGASVPGPAGQVLGLEMIRQKYGDDSPQYQQAKKVFQLSQDSTNSRIFYQNRLANTLPVRILTNQGKSFVEQSNVNQGASPTGTPIGQPVVPGAPGYNPSAPNTPQGNQYGLERTKRNVPASVLQKNIYASNIEKTLGNIDPEALTQYSGLSGALKKAMEQGKAPFGKESDDYDKYNANLNSAKLLAKQVRQFYGDSIQPSVAENLERLSSPSTWRNNPKLAKDLFNNFKTILSQEMSTYRQATEDPGVYQGDTNQQLQNVGEGVVQAVKKVGNNNYVKINGEWYQQ